jgi:hypothetical protein
METSLPSAQPAGEQAAKQGGDAADHGQQHGEADEGRKHPCRLPLAGPEGSAAAGYQQAVTAALDQLAVAILGQVRMQPAAVPAGGAGRAVGLL